MLEALTITIPQQFDSGLWQFIVTLAIVGFLAFAIIDIAKSLALRLVFNLVVVRIWVSKNLKSRNLSEDGTTRAINDIRKFAFGDSTVSMYWEPIEDLCARIKDGAKLTLGAATPNEDYLNAIYRKLPKGSNLGIACAGSTKEFREQQLEDIRFNVDLLELRASVWWSKGIHILAILISIRIIFALNPNEIDPLAKPLEYLEWISFGVVCGLLAPVIKDSFAAIKKVQPSVKALVKE